MLTRLHNQSYIYLSCLWLIIIFTITLALSGCSSIFEKEVLSKKSPDLKFVAIVTSVAMTSELKIYLQAVGDERRVSVANIYGAHLDSKTPVLELNWPNSRHLSIGFGDAQQLDKYMCQAWLDQGVIEVELHGNGIHKFIPTE